MKANNEDFWREYRLYDRANQTDTGDSELAYRLQNSKPDDPDLVGQIVSQYAERMFQWISILMFYCNSALPLKEEVVSALQDVMVSALEHVDRFDGQESVFDWLFSSCYQVVWRNKRGKLINRNSEGSHQATVGDSTISQSARDFWQRIDHLPEKIRTAILLRYGFDLGLADIAIILNLQVKEVHQRISTGRRRLVENPIKSHLDSEISAFVDGMLDENLDELNEVMQLLADCSLCQSAARQINDLEKNVNEILKDRWPFPTISQEELSEVVHTVVEKMHRPEIWWKVRLPIRQYAWILGLTLAFIGMAVLFIRSSPAERELPPPVTPPAPQLPPVINMAPEVNFSLSTSELPADPQYIEPAFSSDGQWAAFASISTSARRRGTFSLTIETFYRETSALQVISHSSTSSRKPWVWWNLIPSISGDGRWIVYTSQSQDGGSSGSPCITGDNEPCLDIFLYDRETGLTKRLTQDVHGGPANSDSLAPVISEDGKWVAFWSAATNLVDGFHSTCQFGGANVLCLYIYLYDLESGAMDWLPVRTIPGEPVFGVDPIRLSADGRFIGFTASRAANAGATVFNGPMMISMPARTVIDGSGSGLPTIKQSSEAVVYDRQSGIYELENQAQDGTPGNAESSTPVLSADGRYVAFVSASTNLVPIDVNDSSDVFVRDRQTGLVELVSVSSSGQKGHGDSGLTFWNRGYYSLNISEDGRYVVFESSAPDLVQDLNPGCSQSLPRTCNILYLHDRQTGETESLTVQNNLDFTLFPNISSDGHWISFMQTFHNCTTSQQFCADVMLYDLQRGWMTNLTKHEENLPSLPWSYSGSIHLPWQTWESTALAISPDGNLLALGGTDSTVRIWQVSDARVPANFKKPDDVLDTGGNEQFSTLAFSPGGEWIAAGTAQGMVYIWNLSDERLLYSLQSQSGLVRKLAFTQHGTQLVIATLYEALIWDINEGRLTQVNKFYYGPTAVYAIDINSSQNILATARGDGLVWLQSLPSGEVLGRLSSSDSSANSLAFSPDGTRLAVRMPEGKIDLWQFGLSETGTPSVKLTSTFQSNVYAGDLSFTPDNNYLASTGMIGEVKLWSLSDGKMSTISASVPDGMVFSLAFSRLGDKLAAVFENEILVWRIPGTSSTSNFFHPIEENYTNALPMPEATANDFLQPQALFSDTLEGNLTLAQAELLLAFPLIVPDRLPENISFGDAAVFKDGSAWLQYYVYNQETYQGSLFILEKYIGNDMPPTMSIGANAKIIHTAVDLLSGQIPAEYVQGDWMLAQKITPAKDGSATSEVNDVWAWDNSLKSERLRWLQDGILIALYFQVYQPYESVLSKLSQNQGTLIMSSMLTLGDLEQIAAGMTPLHGTTSSVMCIFVGVPEWSSTSTGLGSDYIGQECRGLGEVPSSLNQNVSTTNK